MSPRPRTQVFVSLLLALALTHGITSAQQRGRSNRTPPSTRETEAATVRRSQAVELLVETAARARSFNDLRYRARIQALAADALWSFDEPRARQIFRRAWDAAAESDRADEKAAEEEAAIFSGADETSFTESRDEVLAKAAARDPKLAETFSRELLNEEERARDDKGNKASRRTAWRELSPLGARRLALAHELLNRGNYERAAQLAQPLIKEGASGDLMEFLLRLRFRVSLPQASNSDAPGAALSLYLYTLLVDRTAADREADANDVLLLSSYLISPDLLMVVDEKGALQFRSLSFGSTVSARNQTLSRSLKKSFYSLAVSVLLRSSFSRSAANPLQDRVARYFATGRLVPFFEQAGPEFAQFVPALRSQLATLGNEIDAARRDALGTQFELTSLNARNQGDPLAPQLDQLARSEDKQERDRVSLAIVRKAARAQLWDRAQRAAYGIEDGNLKRAALTFIAVNQISDITRAYKDDREDDFEGVARFVRRTEMPAFASAWGLAQAATIAARKKDMKSVRALLSEAESYAARADRGSRQRVAAYVVVTDAAARLEPARAWDLLAELVSSANSTTDYRGDEASLATGGTEALADELAEQLTIEAGAFRLDLIFATMARLDFDKTLAQARTLAGEIPQSTARIAAARAALEGK